MTDLERLFQQLVRKLTGLGPGRVHQPLSLAELRETVLPYRANRRALQLETSEDYEMVLLRLCSGEGGLVRLEPAEVQAEFLAEVGSPNPDLGLLARHEEATLHLEPGAVQRADQPGSADLRFAPPEQRVQPAPPARPRAKAAARKLKCRHCGGELPAGRAVKFCPACGGSQALTHCPSCTTELEAGWKHCITCGGALPQS